MTARTVAVVQQQPPRPAGSLVEWTRAINRLVAGSGSARMRRGAGGRGGARPIANRGLLLTGGDLMPSAGQARDPCADADECRMAPDVAESLVAEGLDPDFLGNIAGYSGLESRDVLDFAGIDRTTVSRRKASGSALPQDAAVKALQITDLLTQATVVFGSPAQASSWLSRPHPALDGETPLRRARTPWGMGKVQSMLVALRYGAVA